MSNRPSHPAGYSGLAAAVLAGAVRDRDIKYIFAPDNANRDLWCAVLDLDPEAYQLRAKRLFRSKNSSALNAYMEQMGAR